LNYIIIRYHPLLYIKTWKKKAIKLDNKNHLPRILQSKNELEQLKEKNTEEDKALTNRVFFLII
jgi:hypothetical protein